MQAETKYDFWEAPDPKKYQRSWRFLRRVIRLGWGLNIIGEENFPQEGPAIYAPVHRSILDPFFVGVVPPRAVFFMAKSEVEQQKRYRWTGMHRYLANRGTFFVARDNHVFDRETNKKAEDVIRDGHILGIFPEATSRNRGVELGETKGGVGWFAVRAAFDGIRCPIVPTGLASENLQLGHPLYVVVGRPFYAEIDGTSRKTARKETNERLRDVLQNLQNQATELSQTWLEGPAK